MLTAFMALAEDLRRIDASPLATLTLKVSMQPESDPNLWVFSACYSRFIFTIKEEQQSAENIKGSLLESLAERQRGSIGAADK